MKLHRAIFAAAAFAVSVASAADAPLLSIKTLRDPEVVEAFRALPAQDGGRIKPLDTLARFAWLLRLSGKQTISLTSSGSTMAATGEPPPTPLNDPATGKPILDDSGKPVRLSAMEWLLVSWFRPDIAKMIPAFTVDNTDALGISDKGKRDRFSYNEIKSWGSEKPKGGGKTPLERVDELRGKNNDDMTPEERALAKLVVDFEDYEMVLNHFNFARAPFANFHETLPPELAAQWPKNDVKQLLGFVPKIRDYLTAHPEARQLTPNLLMDSFESTWHGALMGRSPATILRIFPPADKKVEVWNGPGTLIQSALQKEEITPADAASFAQYGALALADDASFKAKVMEFTSAMVKAAQARNDYRHVPLEVSFYKTEYFYYALLMFVFASLALALSWVAPRSLWGRLCKGSAWALLVTGAVLSISGIVTRCIIMERPPITTLYETILFITTAAVLFGIIGELIARNGLGLTMACIAGAAGMFISIRFQDIVVAGDTMVQLEAVLITNFWLSTHVPCINLGYAAAMVAAIISMIYFVMRLFRRCKPNDVQSRDLTRMAYGFVMAGLLLSLVGTVLGGIWANYSWGRFWGWDPKENGALMIVLMNLIILHARLGGFVKEVGFHALNIVLGIITVFSWFATNQLGIGLHSYGQLSGVWWWVRAFWISQLAFLAYAIVLAFLDRRSHRASGHGGHRATIPPQAAEPGRA